jgi:hypothetical protein
MGRARETLSDRRNCIRRDTGNFAEMIAHLHRARNASPPPDADRNYHSHGNTKQVSRVSPKDDRDQASYGRANWANPETTPRRRHCVAGLTGLETRKRHFKKRLLQLVREKVSGPKMFGCSNKNLPNISTTLVRYPHGRRSSMLLATSSQTSAKSRSSCLTKASSVFWASCRYIVACCRTAAVAGCAGSWSTVAF